MVKKFMTKFYAISAFRIMCVPCRFNIELHNKYL